MMTRRWLPLFAAALTACSSPPEPDVTTTSPPSVVDTPPTAVEATPAPTPEPEPGIALQALVATSGDGVEALVDGDLRTSWKPKGDARLEGVLLRFEELVQARGIGLVGCPGPNPSAVLFVNGLEVGEVILKPGPPEEFPLPDGGLKSVFVRTGARGLSDGCLAEITVVGQDGQALQLAAPRRVGGSISASSTLDPAAAYHPAYLLDGRTHFAWVEGADGNGIGEWIEIRLDAPVRLSGLELWNGYQRSPDHFRKNARAATLEVVLDGTPTGTWSLQDTQGAQSWSLPSPTEVQTIRLVIGEALAGTRYEDLVLSELRLQDEYGPLGVATTDIAQLSESLRAALTKGSMGSLLDRPMDGSGQGCVKARFRSDHSFVWYESWEAGQADSHAEVFEGAWVPGKTQGPWREIKLFGRRNVTSEEWLPYGEARQTQTVRIAGGTVKVAPVASLSSAELFEGQAALCDTGVLAETGSRQETHATLVDLGAYVIRGKSIHGVLW